jgi:hypothetical protein
MMNWLMYLTMLSLLNEKHRGLKKWDFFASDKELTRNVGDFSNDP